MRTPAAADSMNTTPPKKSLQPRPGSGLSSATRFTSLGPAWQGFIRQADHTTKTMKHMLQLSLLVIGLVALCSCSTTSSGKAQANQTDEFETIDSILNDRSKWVDPAFPSWQFYRQP